MTRFAVASLILVALLALACLAGGPWPLAALLYVTVFVALMDRLGRVSPAAAEDARTDGFAAGLSVVLGLAHLALLPLGVWAAASRLPPGQAVVLVLALGLFAGQVSHPNAHELIHAPTRFRRWLGVAVYVSLLFGHHASAHLRVHHVHVATSRDPNSARAGEGYWRFLPRAWAGSFIAGLQAETAAQARIGAPVWRHPYAVYCGGAVVILALALALAGAVGVAVLVAVSAYAQGQILLADYVQHYGLRRGMRPDGRPEPGGPQHSWNTPHWYSSALMLNAPRHSDHHMHPSRPFPALQLDPDRMPLLPHSLPVMAVIALVPPWWRKVMDRRAARWMARG